MGQFASGIWVRRDFELAKFCTYHWLGHTYTPSNLFVSTLDFYIHHCIHTHSTVSKVTYTAFIIPHIVYIVYIYSADTALRTTKVSSAVSWSTTAEKLPVLRAAHSRRKVKMCSYITTRVRDSRMTSVRKAAYLQVDLGDRIRLEILIIIVVDV